MEKDRKKKIWVIATILDVADGWDRFTEVVKREFPEVEGMLLTAGPGCLNLGLIADEPTVRQLTLALMPARYAAAELHPELAPGAWKN